MKSGLVRRPRRTTAFGVVGVVAFAVLGCTSGGDDGDSLMIDDGGEAAAAITGAVEDARSSAGRYESTISMSGVEGDDETSMLVTRGEFSDGAVRAEVDNSMTFGDDDEVDDDESGTVLLAIGDQTFASTTALESLRNMPDVSAEDEEAIGDWPLDCQYDFSVLDGKEWVDTSGLQADLPMEEQSVDPMVSWFLSSWFSTDPFTILDLVGDATELPAGDVDGAPARHLRASLSSEDLMSVLYSGSMMDGFMEFEDDAEPGDEFTRRQRVVDQYLEDHTVVTADVYLDDQDRLLRTTVVARVDIEEQYQDCEMFSEAEGSLTIATDFSDMGTDIVIEAPDPALVITPDQLAAAFPNTIGDESTMTGSLFEEDVPLETVDGPRDSYVVINDLEKFGYVIGLGVDPFSVDPSERSMQPEVWDLSNEELVARYDELAAALAELPHTTTSLGELTRPELLWNVKWGLESIGDTDPASADAFTDAELGGLIDGYVEHNGGPVGDGVMGDLPEGVFDPQVTDEPGRDTDDTSDQFAGCPG